MNTRPTTKLFNNVHLANGLSTEVKKKRARNNDLYWFIEKTSVKGIINELCYFKALNIMKACMSLL